MHVAELVVHTSGDARVFQWRAEGCDKRRHLSRHYVTVNGFNTSLVQVRRRRQWIPSVVLDGNQRINERAVERLGSFIGNKERGSLAFGWKWPWPTYRKSAAVFLKWQTRETERVVAKRVRIERFVAEKIERAHVKLSRSEEHRS